MSNDFLIVEYIDFKKMITFRLYNSFQEKYIKKNMI